MIVELLGLPAVGKTTSLEYLRVNNVNFLNRDDLYSSFYRNFEALHGLHAKSNEKFSEFKNQIIFEYLYESYFFSGECNKVMTYIMHRHRNLFRQRISLLNKYAVTSYLTSISHSNVILDEGMFQFALANITAAECLGFSSEFNKFEYFSKFVNQDYTYILLDESCVQSCIDRYNNREKGRIIVESSGGADKFYNQLQNNINFLKDNNLIQSKYVINSPIEDRPNYLLKCIASVGIN